MQEATLKVTFKISPEGEATTKEVWERTITVTADTDEDEIEPILEEMTAEMFEKYQGEPEDIERDWNDKEIYRIADSLM